jgi:hypothetical protein
MKCQSCEEAISPKFGHAIEINACPYCGQNLMQPELHQVLRDLKNVMKEAEPFMDQVKDWLSANYSLGISKQSTQVSAHPQSELIMDDQFDENTLLRQTQLAKGQLNGFQQRANVKPQPTSAKALIQKIQGGGGYAAEPSEFVGEDPDYGAIDMSNETGEKLSSTDKEAMKNILEAQYSNKDNALEQALELEKIKKLHQGPKGTGPTIKRAAD